MRSKSIDDKFIGSVKIGPKGQIVIPNEVRKLFGLEPGDTLLILADKEKGIALERVGVFAKLADAILSGRAKEIYPEHSEEDSIGFANIIKEINTDSDDIKER